MRDEQFAIIEWNGMRVPREMVSCPRCGHLYGRYNRKVCRSCEECSKCCSGSGLCESPDHIPALQFVEEVEGL